MKYPQFLSVNDTSNWWKNLPQRSFCNGLLSFFHLTDNHFRAQLEKWAGESDAAGLRADWLAIGQDFKTVLQRYQQAFPVKN